MVSVLIRLEDSGSFNSGKDDMVKGTRCIEAGFPRQAFIPFEKMPSNVL